MEELKKILNEINAVSQEIAKIIQTSEVVSYLDLLKIKDKLRNEYDKTLKKIQHECPHKTWYKVKEETDNYEGRTYYTCKCLVCEKVVEDRDKGFEGKIIDSKATYEEVKKIYIQLK